MIEDRRIASSVKARQAIDLAEEHGIAVTPEVFEILSRHIDGSSAELCAEVETALAAPADERTARLMRVRADHCGEQNFPKELERVRAMLATELSEVSARLTEGIRGNLRMTDELRRSLRDLAGFVTREELQMLCRHLVLSGRAHLDDTRSVSDQLERTRGQLKSMERELATLREAASKDHLTGLPNRRSLEERLDILLAEADPFCLALIDLDNFKAVNDGWGHAAGDNVLRGIGQILRRDTKGKDFAARLGGEEFVLVLPDTPLPGAAKLCESIRDAFGEIMWVSQSTRQQIGHLTLSAGVTRRRQTDDALSLLARADGYLYEAKNGGRNQICAGP
ncbi:diguanylate cyclase [Rhodobacteraceae bacterium 2CG4]|uniref:diguanylate cyclase n=1 Tax=Halovulum marinum TaxID=2662447 RepID=A0A6L5YUX2_9RHOB|nr:GGDEF domain-containing protein [Halovulum marinum]MSU88226.1 diguanylate cyclase [Halovulum marinum]